MKTKQLYSAITLLSLLVLLTACPQKRPPVTNPPTFQYITTPTNNMVIPETATSVPLRGRLQSDAMLKHMEYTITYAFPGLTYTIAGLKDYRRWDISRIVEYNTTFEDFNVDVRLDDDNYRTGWYHIDFHAEDDRGNKTTFDNLMSQRRTVFLTRPYIPTIVLKDTLGNLLGNSITLRKDSLLSFDGEITQKRNFKDLAVVSVRIEIYKQDVEAKPFDRVWVRSQDFAKITHPRKDTLPDFTNANVLNITDMFAALDTTKFYSGFTNHNNYRLRVSVEDEGKNYNYREITLNVVP